MTNKLYTISIFTENVPGMLHRVTTVFTKRKINIESIAASESEIKGIHRYTIVLSTTMAMAMKVVYQLEKQVDVLKAFVHEDNQIVFQEIALYKIPTSALLKFKEFELLVREFNARIIAIEEDFTVIEKTGHPEETRELYNRLQSYGILEFVRSGRVAVTKPMKKLVDFLNELEKNYTFKK